MENPYKIRDLGVPLFLETPKWLGGSTTSFYPQSVALWHLPGAKIFDRYAWQSFGSSLDP